MYLGTDFAVLPRAKKAASRSVTPVLEVNRIDSLFSGFQGEITSALTVSNDQSDLIYLFNNVSYNLILL